MNASMTMTTSISATLPASACEIASEGSTSSVQTVATSGVATLSVTGSPPQQQQAGTRMVPLLYIQSPPTTMRLGTNVTNSTGTMPSTTGSQKIVNSVRPTIVTASTQFIPTIGPKLGTTPIITTATSCTTSVTNKSSGSNASGQAPHFVIQASRPSGTGTACAPTIVPVSVAGSGKPTFAYLGTIIKPGVGKTGESQIVLPAGQIMPNSNQKLVLANVPLPLPQLGNASVATGTSTNISQQQTSSKVTSLLVPMTIPAQVGSNKSGMINLKIANGQIHTDSGNKGSVTLVREKCVTTNTSGQLPPLQPIAKIAPKMPGSKNNGVMSDSGNTFKEKAVILQMHRKLVTEENVEAENNNNNNTAEEKKKRNQDLNKCLKEAVDAIFSPGSPKDSNDVRDVGNKDKLDDTESLPNNSGREVDAKNVINSDNTKKEDNCDDLFLQKVPATKQEESKKEISADSAKVEIAKPGNKNSCESNGDTNNDDFDPVTALEWKDGIGTLPGSDLKVKFQMNEFGMMEMVDGANEKKPGNLDSTEERKEEETVASAEGLAVSEKEIKPEMKEDVKKEVLPEVKAVRKPGTSDDIYYCEGCGCYGLASEFVNSRFCSHSCITAYTRKKAAETKRERELLQLRLRRRKKRIYQLLQMQQAQKEKDCKNKKSTVCAPVANNTPASEEDSASNDGISAQTRLPWHLAKSGFSWSKYLDSCKAKGAPLKLFKDPFPYTKNGFRVGMKLEGVDPEHPSYFCVLSISDVQGYRIKLHFDGYSENHDFWVNADSMDMFPPGWCEKNNRTLHPPGGFSGQFSWANYLKQCKAQAAPRHLFMNKTGSAVCPHGFRLGMKLEAVDKKNSSLVCVATVSDVMDNRLLIHFDSWDDVYDYWADPTSPYIHPVGWCEEHNHPLTQPNNYKGQSFSWEAYLKETKSVAAPARAFKQRPPCGFKRGMKLECVDKWVPMLIRVVSVVEVVEHQIKVHFDGWPDEYSYWIDDRSPDIHPVGWCQKTGHPLEPPLSWDDAMPISDCPTPGCRGLGHAKGAKLVTHSTSATCPYASQNILKDNLIPDRLLDNMEGLENKEESNLKDDVKVGKEETSSQENPKPSKPSRPPKCRRTAETLEDSKSQGQENDWKQDDDDDHCDRKRKKRRTPLEEHSSSPTAMQMPSAPSIQTNGTGADLERLQQEMRLSVIQPGYEPNPNNFMPHLWTKHSQYLNSFIVQHKGSDASQWTQEEVEQFVNSIPGCESKAKIFKEQQIDGEALLMMAQEDLVNVIGMKLGPAIKLYNSIVLLRQKVIEISS